MILVLALLIDLVTIRGSESACNVTVTKRNDLDCGFRGITEDFCTKRQHCCWAEAKDPSVPYCFFGQGIAQTYTPKSKTKCQHQGPLSISCSPSEVIHILAVFYGHHESSVCHIDCNPKPCTICGSKNGTDIVNQYCYCKSSCSIDLTKDEWKTGGHCDKFNKVMDVKYSCVPKTAGVINCAHPSSPSVIGSSSTASAVVYNSFDVSSSWKAWMPETLSRTLQFSSQSLTNASAEHKSIEASTQSLVTSSFMSVALQNSSFVPKQNSATSAVFEGSNMTISNKTLVLPATIFASTGGVIRKTSLNITSKMTSMVQGAESSQSPMFSSIFSPRNRTSVMLRNSSVEWYSHLGLSINKTVTSAMLDTRSKAEQTTLASSANATSRNVVTPSPIMSTSPGVKETVMTSKLSSATQVIRPNSTSKNAGMTTRGSEPELSSLKYSQTAVTSAFVSSTSMLPSAIQSSPLGSTSITSTTLEVSPSTAAAFSSISSKYSSTNSVRRFSSAPSFKSSSTTKSSVRLSSTSVSASSSTKEGTPSPSTVLPLFSSYSSVMNPGGKTSPKRSLSIGAKIGISVAVCVILLTMLIVVVLCYRRRTTKNQFRYLDDFSPAPGTYSSIDPTMVQMSDLDTGGYDADAGPQSAYDNVGLVNDG